jgi:hypothetical protein
MGPVSYPAMIEPAQDADVVAVLVQLTWQEASDGHYSRAFIFGAYADGYGPPGYVRDTAPTWPTGGNWQISTNRAHATDPSSVYWFDTGIVSGYTEVALLNSGTPDTAQAGVVVRGDSVAGTGFAVVHEPASGLYIERLGFGRGSAVPWTGGRIRVEHWDENITVRDATTGNVLLTTVDPTYDASNTARTWAGLYGGGDAYWAFWAMADYVPG